MNSVPMEVSFFPSLYFKMIWFLMPLCAVVFIEPSPYDFVILLAFVIGVYCSYLIFPSYMGLPLLLIGIFLLSNLIPMLFVNDGQLTSIKYFLITFYLFVSWLFFVGLHNRFKEKILKVIFSGYVAAALFSTLIGVLAYLNIIPTFDILTKYGRVTAFFKDPNVFGPFVVPAVVIALHNMVTKRRQMMLFWIPVFIFLAVGVLLSFSRAAWANCFIACTAYLLFPYSVHLKKRLIALLSILIIAAPIMGYVIASPSINSMFVDRFGMKKYDDDRFGTQQKALSQVLESPLGIGPGQSELVYSYATHSLYVRVITEYGIIGFIAFMLFLMITIYRAFYNACLRKSPYHAYFIVFFSCLIGILFNSFFVDTLHWRHFWLLLALPWMPNGSNPRQSS